MPAIERQWLQGNVSCAGIAVGIGRDWPMDSRVCDEPVLRFGDPGDLPQVQRGLGLPGAAGVRHDELLDALQ